MHSVARVERTTRKANSTIGLHPTTQPPTRLKSEDVRSFNKTVKDYEPDISLYENDDSQGNHEETIASTPDCPVHASGIAAMNCESGFSP